MATKTSTEAREFKTKAQILALDDRRYEDVWIEPWSTFVRVRGLTAGERDSYEAAMLEGRGKNQKVNLENARARLVAMAVVNEDGTQMFTRGEASVLSNKSSEAINQIWETARKLSAMSDEDVEELTGESEADPNSDSSSD